MSTSPNSEGRVPFSSVPEQGQLVEVRRRQRVVADVGESAFRELFAPTRQGLVGLASVDEGSLGEELQVLWQLEPGARVLERAGPLDALLHALITTNQVLPV
jgi:hypothetical protein